MIVADVPPEVILGRPDVHMARHVRLSCSHARRNHALQIPKLFLTERRLSLLARCIEHAAVDAVLEPMDSEHANASIEVCVVDCASVVKLKIG